MISVKSKLHLENLSFAIARLKERIRRLQVLTKGADTPFWGALKGELESSIESSQKLSMSILQKVAISEDPTKDFIDAKCPAFEVRALRGVIADVDRADDKVHALNEKIGVYNREIDQIKKESNGLRKQPNTLVPSRGRSNA